MTSAVGFNTVGWGPSLAYVEIIIAASLHVTQINRQETNDLVQALQTTPKDARGGISELLTSSRQPRQCPSIGVQSEKIKYIGQYILDLNTVVHWNTIPLISSSVDV
jgi:hypothetical protein